MANTIIHWGIIGVGNVCEVKSGPGFYKAPASKLLAVMRRHGDQARDFALRHQVPLWYDNADALLNNPDIHAVYIATPPAQHQHYALAALEAGKYVYIEKPVTRNASECDAIIDAQTRRSGKVCVAHYRRQLPRFLKIAELLTTGAIGKPLLVRIDMLRPAAPRSKTEHPDYWRVNPDISGGGLFHDLAPHQLDLLLSWFGKVRSASGIGQNQQQHTPAHDCIHGWAQFESGVTLQGRWHFATHALHNLDHCEIIGTEGTLTFSFFDQPTIQLSRPEGIQEFIIPNPEHIQQPLIEQVNAYFRGERDNPSNLTDAKAVMELIDCFSRS